MTAKKQKQVMLTFEILTRVRLPDVLHNLPRQTRVKLIMPFELACLKQISFFY